MRPHLKLKSHPFRPIFVLCRPLFAVHCQCAHGVNSCDVVIVASQVKSEFCDGTQAIVFSQLELSFLMLRMTFFSKSEQFRSRTIHISRWSPTSWISYIQTHLWMCTCDKTEGRPVANERYLLLCSGDLDPSRSFDCHASYPQ